MKRCPSKWIRQMQTSKCERYHVVDWANYRHAKKIKNKIKTKRQKTLALSFVSSSVYIIVCFWRSGKKQLCFEGLGVDDRSVRWGWALLLVFILTCPLFYLDGIDVDGADRIGFCDVIWVGPTDWWSLVTNRTSGKKRVDFFERLKKSWICERNTAVGFSCANVWRAHFDLMSLTCWKM